MTRTKTFRITEALRSHQFQRTQARRTRALNRERLRNAARKAAADEALREMECEQCIADMYKNWDRCPAGFATHVWLVEADGSSQTCINCGVVVGVDLSNKAAA